MKTKLQEMLIRHEDIRNKPYRCTAGKLTIGVGRNIEDRGLSDEECMYLLSNDIAGLYQELKKVLPWFENVSDTRRAALIDMAFMGVPRLLGFNKMLAAASKGHWDEAAREALDSKWAKDVGPNRSGEVAEMLRTGEWQQ